MIWSSVSLCGRCMVSMADAIEDQEVPQVNEERHWSDPYDEDDDR